MLLEREEPTSRLESSLNAARAGTGRIVSLEGEAGIGKTALALRFVARHRGDAQVYIGCCEQLSTPEPLGPLRDIERQWPSSVPGATWNRRAQSKRLLERR